MFMGHELVCEIAGLFYLFIYLFIYLLLLLLLLFLNVDVVVSVFPLLSLEFYLVSKTRKNWPLILGLL